MRILFITLMTCFAIGCSDVSLEQQVPPIERELKSGNASKSLILAKNLLQDSVEVNDQALILKAKRYLAQSYYLVGDYENSLRFYLQFIQTHPETASLDDWHTAIFVAIEEDKDESLLELLSKAESKITGKAFRLYQKRLTPERKLRRFRIDDSAHKFTKLQDVISTFSIDEEQGLLKLQNLIEQYPDFAEANLYLGRAYQLQQNYKDALVPYIKFEQLRPIHPYAKLQVAALAVQSAQPETARPYIADLKKLMPHSAIVIQLEGAIELTDGNYTKSKDLAEQSIGFGLDSHMNRLVAGTSSFRLKHWDQANTHLSRIADTLPREHPAIRMLIASKLALNEPDQALKLFRSLDNLELGDLSTANELAAQLVANGRLNLARYVQNKASSVKHENSALKATQASIDLSIKQLEYKEKLVKSASNATVNSDDKTKLILIHLNDDEIAEAKFIAELWYEQEPDNLEAINSLATVELAYGNISNGKQLLTKALELDPNNLPSLIFELQTLKDRKEWDQLESKTQQLMTKQKVNSVYIFSYWLEAIAQQNSDIPMQLAKSMILQERAYEAVLISTLVGKNNYSALNEYLTKYLAKKDWQEIHYNAAISTETATSNKIKLLKEFIDKGYVYDARTLNFVIDHAYTIRAYDVILDAINSASQQGLNSKNVIVEHTIALLNSNRVEDAETLLNATEEKSAEVQEALYELQTYKGFTALAWDTLVKSIILNPTANKFFKLKSIAATDNKAKTLKTLLLKLAPVTEQEQLIRAEASQWYIVDDPTTSLQLLDSPAMENMLKNNYILSNNLAWLLSQSGDINRAKRFAQQALSLAPENKQVKDTYNKIFGF